MIRRPPRATRTDTLFPYTTLFRSLLRRNEIFSAVGGQTGDDATRPALRAWVDTHFKEIEAKLAPAGASLVYLYAAGMCSDAEAAELESKFTARKIGRAHV